ncbi:Glycosyl-hydrolase 97 C-terminal, oligomerisation [Alkalitalea saponilacus]|uniref:Glycosyl-hydrolase 97 C-terminal, oligomerisation n=2 Tax=Alkalitalea saponilacus TaxID=889453 RepID=A0A1T5AB07_9BACT|nr:Glycosyl-hydrolase 97 C-terminal, oligomerisation [Alkalitalea saponilacus]
MMNDLMLKPNLFRWFIPFVFAFLAFPLMSQKAVVLSPNSKNEVMLLSEQDGNTGSWYLQVNYISDDEKSEVIPRIDLGLIRNDQSFSDNLRFLKASRPKRVVEQYTSIHGKRSERSNVANEVVMEFENSERSRINVVVRAYNDGIVFRYEFPRGSGTYTILDELTSYHIPDSTTRWLQDFDLSNEHLYTKMKDAQSGGDWGYPALFNTPDTGCWYLIHEAGLDRTYCATKLNNSENVPVYKVTLPYPHEGKGEALPTINLPWKSPWRVVIMGALSDIVESTLVDDVSKPSVLENTDWIKPGLVSWNYWSDNHGTRCFQTVAAFTDLAAAMGWPYTLFDWEWDVMSNGGNVEDAARYALSKGVKPFLWYNSGMFQWITATPIDRMKTHENRMEEFAWLKSLGFVGVKVDFFLSEKQYMIEYYLDILEDAAKFEMMVNFHGSVVPRGWARTYPHLMTLEGVRGAEWYNNGPEFTTTAPEHNSVMAFTRNVVGSMDYTPVTFTNSQYPSLTSYGHELALSVLYESALQHMADRPEGYYNLPDAPKSFLKDVPVAWDDTKLLDGYPGRDVVMARRNDKLWYVGGINSENVEKNYTLSFDFLDDGVDYRIVLISDGNHDKDFSTYYSVVNKSSTIDVKMLRRGGFAAKLQPMNN